MLKNQTSNPVEQGSSGSSSSSRKRDNGSALLDTGEGLNPNKPKRQKLSSLINPDPGSQSQSSASLGHSPEKDFNVVFTMDGANGSNAKKGKPKRKAYKEGKEEMEEMEEDNGQAKGDSSEQGMAVHNPIPRVLQQILREKLESYTSENEVYKALDKISKEMMNAEGKKDGEGRRGKKKDYYRHYLIKLQYALFGSDILLFKGNPSILHHYIQHHRWAAVKGLIRHWSKILSRVDLSSVDLSSLNSSTRDQDLKRLSKTENLHLNLARAIFLSDFSMDTIKAFMESFKPEIGAKTEIALTRKKNTIVKPRTFNPIIKDLLSFNTSHMREKMVLLLKYGNGLSIQDIKDVILQLNSELERKYGFAKILAEREAELTECFKDILGWPHIQANLKEIGLFALNESSSVHIVSMLDRLGVYNSIDFEKHTLAIYYAKKGCFLRYKELCESLEKQNKNYLDNPAFASANLVFELLNRGAGNPEIVEILEFIFKHQPQLVEHLPNDNFPLLDARSHTYFRFCPEFLDVLPSFLRYILERKPNCLKHMNIKVLLNNSRMQKKDGMALLKIIHDLLPDRGERLLVEAFESIVDMFSPGEEELDRRSYLERYNAIYPEEARSLLEGFLKGGSDPIGMLNAFLAAMKPRLAALEISGEPKDSAKFTCLLNILEKSLKSLGKGNLDPVELTGILNHWCCTFTSYKHFADVAEMLVRLGAQYRHNGGEAMLFELSQGLSERMRLMGFYSHKKELAILKYLLDKGVSPLAKSDPRDGWIGGNFLDWVAAQNIMRHDGLAIYERFFMESKAFETPMRNAREKIQKALTDRGYAEMLGIQALAQSPYCSKVSLSIKNAMKNLDKRYLAPLRLLAESESRAQSRNIINMGQQASRLAIDAKYKEKLAKICANIREALINSLIQKLQTMGEAAFCPTVSQNSANKVFQPAKFCSDILFFLPQSLLDPQFVGNPEGKEGFWMLPEYVALRWLSLSYPSIAEWNGEPIASMDPDSHSHSIAEGLVVIWQAIHDKELYAHEKERGEMVSHLISALAGMQRARNIKQEFKLTQDLPAEPEQAFPFLMGVLNGRHRMVKIKEFTARSLFDMIRDFYEDIFSKLSHDEKMEIYRVSRRLGFLPDAFIAKYKHALFASFKDDIEAMNLNRESIESIFLEPLYFSAFKRIKRYGARFEVQGNGRGMETKASQESGHDPQFVRVKIEPGLEAPIVVKKESMDEASYSQSSGSSNMGSFRFADAMLGHANGDSNGADSAPMEDSTRQGQTAARTMLPQFNNMRSGDAGQNGQGYQGQSYQGSYQGDRPNGRAQHSSR